MGASLEPSPTASTRAAEKPPAAQNASTAAHFETPPGITLTDQPGHWGSGAKSTSWPDSTNAATTGRRATGSTPSTEKP
jgi:hypothetical protein